MRSYQGRMGMNIKRCDCRCILLRRLHRGVSKRRLCRSSNVAACGAALRLLPVSGPSFVHPQKHSLKPTEQGSRNDEGEEDRQKEKRKKDEQGDVGEPAED